MSIGRGWFNKFQRGEYLSPRQAIIAQCFICNGEGEGSSEDCRGLSCPLYPYFKKWVYRVGRQKKVDSTSQEGHFVGQ